MRNCFKCIFLNINSLISKHKRHYFNLFLLEHKPDVVLIAEHKLSSHHNISFKGYNFIRQNRSSGLGGGTAICIKDNYKFEQIVIRVSSMENTIIKLSLANSSDIYFVACYCKPSDCLVCNDFTTIINSLNTDNIVFGGDFNAKHSDWGDPLINTNGRKLCNWLRSNLNFNVIPTKYPTRTVSCPSFIDFFITSASIDINFDPSFNNKLRTLYAESDHFAVELPILLDNISLRQPIEIFNYNKMNTSVFNQILTENLKGNSLPVNRNCTISEIDNNLIHLNRAFNMAIEASTPKITIRSKGQINLTPKILNFIKEKKNLRRSLYRCVDPDRKVLLKAIIQNLDKIIKDLIIINEEEYWNKYFKNFKFIIKFIGKSRDYVVLKKKINFLI